jgi:Tol biopolymer transport system component
MSRPNAASRSAARTAALALLAACSGSGDGATPPTDRGTQIAYARSSSPTALGGEIWVQPADGGTARRLDAGGSQAFDLAISPDGRSLAFVEIGRARVLVADLASASLTPVFQGSLGLVSPSWVENGRRIALINGLEPYVVDPDGRNPTPAVPAGAPRPRGIPHQVSPDGRWLAYAWAEAPDGAEDLYVQELATGRTVRLTRSGPSSPPVSFVNAAWSPDGSRLAVERWGSDGSVRIWVVGADGTGLRQVSPNGTADHSQPAWKPDGTALAFTCAVPGQRSDVCVVQLDGSGYRNLTNSADAAEDSPAWGVVP